LQNGYIKKTLIKRVWSQANFISMSTLSIKKTQSAMYSQRKTLPSQWQTENHIYIIVEVDDFPITPIAYTSYLPSMVSHMPK
jgi:hypothetical protein